MKEKILVFDMDGTLADFYGVTDWLEDLKESNPRPYEQASPLYDMAVLNYILNLLKSQGWHIVVTSWLSKDSTREFKKSVRAAKREWLNKYNFPYDEIHLVQYGTTKADCTRKYGGFQVLVDDNEKVRKGWHLGNTVDANKNILIDLLSYLEI